jgi:hypothetical protein
MRSPAFTSGCWLLASLLAACQGSLDAPSSSAAADAPGAAGQEAGIDPTAQIPIAGSVRRLTRFEYDRTIYDLLEVDAKARAEFPADETALGFDNNSDALMFSPALAEQLFSKAQQLAPAAVARASQFAPCAASEKSSACARNFIEAFGSRAFRRPLTAAEIDGIAKTIEPHVASGRFERALELVAETVLSSFAFLYRVELNTGAPAPGKAGLRELSSYERAARLSYALWGSLPDQALLELASRNGLSDVAAVRSEAQRLLASARSREVLGRFHEQWLQLAPIESANHDPALFPDYTPEIPKLLRRELDLLLDHAAFEGDGLTDLLSASYTFVNQPLAEFYGMSGITGADFRRVELDASKYAGLLTRAGVLSAHSGFSFTSPTRRGAFVRRRLLCQDLPPPPPGVVTTPAPETPGKTRRDLIAQHSSDPSCASCHAKIDPIGLGLEDFDATGRFRALENGAPVDASGAVPDTSLGAFHGAGELGQKLAASAEARACAATQLFRYLAGRQETAADSEVIASMSQAGTTGGEAYRGAILAFIASDQFMYLGKEEP